MRSSIILRIVNVLQIRRLKAQAPNKPSNSNNPIVRSGILIILVHKATRVVTCNTEFVNAHSNVLQIRRLRTQKKRNDEFLRS